MNTSTITWILQGLLGFIFFLAGVMKLVQPRKKVIASGGKWAEDFSAPSIKVIGAVEATIALGLIVPRLMDHAMTVQLTLAACVGAMATMAGAFITHARRKETPFLGVTGFIFALAAALAWLYY